MCLLAVSTSALQFGGAKELLLLLVLYTVMGRVVPVTRERERALSGRPAGHKALDDNDQLGKTFLVIISA